jgi:hypothetical protein
MEKIDASGPNAMFGDDDMNFDLQLEEFVIDTNALKEPATEHVFCAWVEDWEVELRKTMNQLQRHACSRSKRSCLC